MKFLHDRYVLETSLFVSVRSKILSSSIIIMNAGTGVGVLSDAIARTADPAVDDELELVALENNMSHIRGLSCLTTMFSSSTEGAFHDWTNDSSYMQEIFFTYALSECLGPYGTQAAQACASVDPSMKTVTIADRTEETIAAAAFEGTV